MTKKDYVLIADSIKKEIASYSSEYREQKEALRWLAINLAKSLKENNDQFDYFRFMQACGIEW